MIWFKFEKWVQGSLSASKQFAVDPNGENNYLLNDWDKQDSYMRDLCMDWAENVNYDGIASGFKIVWDKMDVRSDVDWIDQKIKSNQEKIDFLVNENNRLQKLQGTSNQKTQEHSFSSNDIKTAYINGAEHGHHSTVESHWGDPTEMADDYLKDLLDNL